MSTVVEGQNMKCTNTSKLSCSIESAALLLTIDKGADEGEDGEA